jgi:hypothetical protein
MNSQPTPQALSTRPFTLVLVSHSYAPPLLPAPHLKFDLRKVSNPPKHARDACDGRSKHLREHLLASEDFCALLETAQASIEGKTVVAEKQSEDDREVKKTKTYNRRDSQMVTHSSTSRPVQCLCMAERTGCPVFTDLWSYVLKELPNCNIKLRFEL